MADQRHRKREQEAAQASVWGRARIGNHEKGEDEQRSALQLMDRNREWISEPPGSREQQSGVTGEKENRNVGAPGRMQTRIAKKPSSAANQMVEPHWPGEIHTPFDVHSSTTMANPAGFQMCLPSIRSTNFEPMR